MNDSLFSGAVLAGGRSSRMGQDKALLKISGRTFLDIQLKKLRDAGIRELMISCAADRLLEREQVKTVEDRVQAKGPLAAIQAVLYSSAAPFCAILSVDSILVKTETIQALMTLAEKNNAPIVLLASPKGPEPLTGIYKKDVILFIDELIEADRLAVKNLFAQYPPLLLETSEDDPQLLNCNTPKDYETIKALSDFAFGSSSRHPPAG